MTKPARNAPCHCGSGQKYKHCHLDSDLAAELRATPGAPLPPEAFKTDSRAWIMPTLVALALLVGVGLWRGLGDGLIVAAAWGIGAMAWMAFRDPPPPNANPGDPAALNFGRSDDRKK